MDGGNCFDLNEPGTDLGVGGGTIAEVIGNIIIEMVKNLLGAVTKFSWRRLF